MANDDLIRGGTASVTAGQVAVTGQGVSWANVREGDFFGAHVGLAVPIAAIAGNAITLAFPWTGPTQAAAAYAIQPKGDVTRFQDRVRLLVESLANGTLAALTAAGSATDKIAYYSGAGVAALTDFKASARSLLGLTPAAGKLPYFTDANTAALADLSAFARTNVINKADRAALLASGTGIGISTSVEKFGAVAADLNAITHAGWVSAYPAATANCPLPANAWLWEVLTLFWVDGVTCTQHARRIAGGDIQYFRSGTVGGTFSAWAQQVQQGFTSIEQAGYAGQAAGTKINIGWDSATGGLRAAAGGNQDLGKIWTDYSAPFNHNAGSGSGYYKLPNGFLFQYGFIQGNSGAADQAITFPTGFPSGFRGALCMPSGDPSLNAWVCSYDTVSNSGMTIRRRNVANGGAVSAPYPSFVTAWAAWGT